MRLFVIVSACGYRLGAGALCVGGCEDEEECLFLKQTPTERHNGGVGGK